MKYLITDPCYIVPRDDWETYCNDGLTDFYEGETSYKIGGLGTIIASSPTTYGDGYAKMGNGKQVLVDSGTVCLVQLDDGVVPTDYQGNAVASSRETADKWYEKAQTI